MRGFNQLRGPAFLIVGICTALLMFSGVASAQIPKKPDQKCINNIIETGEICDGTALAGDTCLLHGFDGGDLACLADCSNYDEGPCYNCGDGAQNPGEQCDGGDLAGAVQELIGRAKPGSYLAIMPYLMQTPDLDQSLTRLRAQMMKRHRTATTVGYGPRFLHSTGQLHKGGPDSGLFLQITEDRDGDVAIPGEPHSFGVLADAQAQGDLEALQGNGRPVARLQVKAADVSRVAGLIDEMS